MAVELGSRLGPYEILSAIGAGGKVYRARDTKLSRVVALKILPDAFVNDPDRLARFKREAHVLASLNHPNSAAIYGFEDSDGAQALVLELVEGRTLAERLAQGAGLKAQGLPLDEALAIARQIAEALEAAHEQGIIHRDLKPANIKLRPDGMVKVLDFGLAKALEPSASSVTDATMSPTMTSPAMTQMGVILGSPVGPVGRPRPGDRHLDLGSPAADLEPIPFDPSRAVGALRRCPRCLGGRVRNRSVRSGLPRFLRTHASRRGRVPARRRRGHSRWSSTRGPTGF